MNLMETVNGLADVLNEKNLSVISVKCDDLEIRIASKNASPAPKKVADIQASAEKRGDYIKSPIIGTFYAAPSPEKPPFVKVGDRVEKGRVVCIIESMKLMNEITSDFDGLVAEILVKDGETVDFNKELMRIE
ncbi:MAG: acetyl-CoA carboxylase biotin carboxyl carrier protein [Oscillospiraceae bacterium]|jgi:acetyl-CoA carboxylase biotin carboxyl carrier protein|nr:acetyl-CoA carboxylase biotin carboxyl carrier protein [Oscillospiraceae bacterium]